jgi:hypothetical protein
MMSNAFVGVIIQRLVNHSIDNSGVTLWDLGFETLPYISSNSGGVAVPDLCSLGSATLVAFGLVAQFEPGLAGIILRRVLLISAIAYFGRAFSVPWTLLPNPDPDCAPILNETSPTVFQAMLVPFGMTVTCADVFYSGHTIPITCACLVWTDYMRRSYLRPLGLCVSSLALLGIIATHFHYTIDVLYGFAVTWSVWRMYHLCLSCPALMDHFRILSWWESDGALSSERSYGVHALNLSKDPRILWSFKKTPSVSRKLSRAQILLLFVVALTLSPSWIAVYHKSTLSSPV